ncbi:TonB-dependent receptor [Chitinophaga ginsengisegetis]|uniref:SusC/RagA family TonB-linked outer membrane protein n=1 Tax=Chitinophaga ginsengisegetis TaxID=393003 RepID=UPI003431300F
MLLLLFLLPLFSRATVSGAPASFTSHVTGVVTDIKGNPLPGAKIMIKGMNKGSIADEKGIYMIDVPDRNTVLVFSCQGFAPQEVLVGDQNRINIHLQETVKKLDEVIVVGYGEVRKGDLTGSVASIRSEELLKSNPVTLEQGLQGRVAGVAVTQTDGAPGSGMSIQIRGSNSIMGGTEPLYVIDGVPVVSDNATTPGSLSLSEVQQVNKLSFLNPQDIESIDILKDASATAIYGSRGANGVVMITTKKGKKGVDKISFNAVTSLSAISKKYNMLDAETYAGYQNETYRNSDIYLGTSYQTDNNGLGMPYPAKWDSNANPVRYKPGPQDYKNRSTNWQDVIFQTGIKQDYSLTFSGGTNQNTYLISGNVVDQKGIIANSSFKRYSVRADINRSVKSWLQVGTNANFSNTVNNLVVTGSSIVGMGGGVIKSALSYYPTVPLKDTVTNDYSELYFTSNPYTFATKALNKITGYRFFNSSYAEITFRQGLKFRSVLGWDVSNEKRDQYYPVTTLEGRSYKGRAFVADNNSQTISSENYFTYDKRWGKHALNTTLGLSYSKGTWQWKQISADGFVNDVLEDNNLGAATTINQPASGKSDWKMISYFGRANYIYNNRYLVTATYRRDGSSKFAVNSKWAGFASVAMGWNISEENFFQPLKTTVSNLKLRASYGTSGNQAIPSYGSLSRVGPLNYPYGGSVTNGFADNAIGNASLRWETTRQTNLGLDLGLLRDRLSLIVDVYDKRTSDLLQNVVLPSSTGFTNQLRNIGVIGNKGLEVSVLAGIIDNQHFKWQFNGNISFNRNKILSLGPVQQQFAGTIGTVPINYQPFLQRVGEPVGILYGYKEDGIYQSEEEVTNSKFFEGQAPEIIKRTVGEIRYADLDGDGKITAKDQTIIGNVNPDYTFGITNSFSYKQLDLSIFVQGVVGGDIINTLHYMTDNIGNSNNTTVDAYNKRWTGPGSGGTNPKAMPVQYRSMYFSDRFIEDGSYVRLKNIDLGYTFRVNDHSFVRSLRVYISINNLVTFTGYSGYDPEVNAFGQDPARRAVDFGNYPNTRTYSFGLNLSL